MGIQRLLRGGIIWRSLQTKPSAGWLLVEGTKVKKLGGMVGITGKPKQGIESGGPADFVVCSGDPMSKDSYVMSTWIDGRPVWQHPDSQKKDGGNE